VSKRARFDIPRRAGAGDTLAHAYTPLASSDLLDIADALSLYADSPAEGLHEHSGPPSHTAAPHERRAHARVRPFDLRQPVLARLKHGPLLTLLDLSPGGALIETAARLNPGAHLVLEFVAPGERHITVIPSRVLRAQVAALEGGLRYRGGFVFKEQLVIPGLGGEEQPAALDACDLRPLAGGIGHLRALAVGSRDRESADLVDEILPQLDTCGSVRELMTVVEDRLRRHVPLLAISFAAASRARRNIGESLSFDLGPAEAEGPQRMYVEFRPASRLGEAQMRMLHTGASLMGLLYGWRRSSAVTW
jgi:hypothetical protein